MLVKISLFGFVTTFLGRTSYQCLSQYLMIGDIDKFVLRRHFQNHWWSQTSHLIL